VYLLKQEAINIRSNLFEKIVARHAVLSTCGNMKCECGFQYHRIGNSFKASEESAVTDCSSFSIAVSDIHFIIA
jgi:hypothetical protein